jgi:hypothetical protein
MQGQAVPPWFKNLPGCPLALVGTGVMNPNLAIFGVDTHVWYIYHTWSLIEVQNTRVSGRGLKGEKSGKGENG